MKTLMPTLERILKVEQVRQKECYSVKTYLAEMEYVLWAVTNHKERIEAWLKGGEIEAWLKGGESERFNPEFRELMRELEAMSDALGVRRTEIEIGFGEVQSDPAERWTQRFRETFEEEKQHDVD